MIRLISLILALIMLVSITISASAADANTEVNSVDIVVLRKVLLSAAKLKSNVADMNYDGEVNIIDLVRLKKKISGVELTSIFRNQANMLKTKVLDAADSVPAISGKTYHISANGSSTPDGSIDSPYSYSQFINGTIDLESGDAVLLKRGDIFRGVFIVETDNIYIGAYGTGKKPLINGSAKNYAEASWTNEGNSIYSVSGIVSDAGIIAFNDCEKIGFKKSSKNELINDLDFWYDNTNKKVYLYSSKAPSSYNSIEIGVKSSNNGETNDLIRIVANGVTLDNLSLKYAGGHGVRVYDGSSDVTIKNCEIAFIGGSYLSGTTRFGNGIELWLQIENVLVENNWIHDIYDSGVTHQGSGAYEAKNITINANLIERCGLASIEYWLGFSDPDGDGSYSDQSKCININYTNNILCYAGYGFGGEQRPNKGSSHIRSDVKCPNVSEGFNIENNIFDMSTGDLLEIGGTKGPLPILSGNIYAQHSNSSLGAYGSLDVDDFGLFVKDAINYNLGDITAKVYYY